MGRIKQLSKNIINQIAAGEVIERPASVVKELVENSIDAGATKISIEITNECRNIRVADNGSGIHPDDILLAFSKHATSKIESSDDLYNIHTLGFRGEALASIISISKVTCITRTKDFDYGTKVECENSEVKYSDTGCAVGTIMQISDLFYNIPARLKFLKTEKTEFAYITELVTAIALSHPDVGIELKHNSRTILKTNGIDSLENVIKNLFSKEIFSNLNKIENTDKLSNISIEGYVSRPDFTRSNKKDYHIFVNGRTVKCPVSIKAIDMAYKNSIPNGKYPFVVLMLNINPEDIDINVHPTKKEVKYKNTNQIYNFICNSVQSGILKYDIPKYTQFENVYKLNNPDKETNEDEKEIFAPIETINTQRIEQAIETYNNIKYTEQRKTHPIDIPIKQNNSTQQKIINDEIKQHEKIIGQYKDTYILIECDDGIEIIDQHIADERYIYETLQKQYNTNSQLLFVSDVIEVDAKESEIIKENLPKFKKYGYEIEFINENEIIFRKIPQILSKFSPKEILKDIMENIEGKINNLEEKILITTSCKAAVKANTPLPIYRMEEIVSRLRTCKNPYTCPHGRPISRKITHSEISGYFMRPE